MCPDINSRLKNSYQTEASWGDPKMLQFEYTAAYYLLCGSYHTVGYAAL